MAFKQRSVAAALAAAFLAGPWELDGLVERARQALAIRGRWLRPLARRVLKAFPQDRRPSLGMLTKFIGDDAGFLRYGATASVAIIARRAELLPRAGAASTWRLPTFATSGDLAEWLGISCGELDWFADCNGRTTRLPPGPLHHYTYRWLPKRSGGFRLLETPKSRLKAFQRELLHGLLDHIPPHAAAHGFRARRSIVTFAAPHAGRRVVLRMDLRNFFSSINAARVVGLFMTAGYSESVSRLLAGLCTNRAAEFVWQSAVFNDKTPRSTDMPDAELLRRPHLPQGAPTSPALANLCAYRLDCRLDGLARSAGAAYSRYADDLLFSGGAEFARCVQRFRVHASAIAQDEGFQIHDRKTRIMRRGVRQHAVGLVLNDRPNIHRQDFDRLKAILHNCARHGAESQNRRAHANFQAHLSGAVAHVAMVNPQRGARLRAMLARIAW